MLRKQLKNVLCSFDIDFNLALTKRLCRQCKLLIDVLRTKIKSQTPDMRNIKTKESYSRVEWVKHRNLFTAPVSTKYMHTTNSTTITILHRYPTLSWSLTVRYTYCTCKVWSAGTTSRRTRAQSVSLGRVSKATGNPNTNHEPKVWREGRNVFCRTKQ